MKENEIKIKVFAFLRYGKSLSFFIQKENEFIRYILSTHTSHTHNNGWVFLYFNTLSFQIKQRVLKDFWQ